MICISSITYCIKIDWDFYQLLITLCDERATSSGGFFVRNSFTLPLREVCVSIKLSFQYKREGKKSCFLFSWSGTPGETGICQWDVNHFTCVQLWNVFQNCEQAQFWKKNKAIFYNMDMKNVSIKIRIEICQK